MARTLQDQAFDALEAIRALLNGEWDNPKLKAVGPLSTDWRENIRWILDTYGMR